MYNGIGLTTTRGSATSGYVQRNTGHIKPEFFRNKLDRNRASGRGNGFDHGTEQKIRNQDLLEHNRKHAVEAKVFELQEELRDKGIPEEDIQQRCQSLRERLTAANSAVAVSATSSTAVTSYQNRSGGYRGGQPRDRPRNNQRYTDSHEISLRKEEENARVKAAFGIGDDYVPGSAFDPEVQERRRQQRLAEREAIRLEREQRYQQRLQERQELAKAHSRERSRSRSPNVARRGDDREGRQSHRQRGEDKERRHRRRRSPSYSSSSSDSDSDSDSSSNSSSSDSSYSSNSSSSSSSSSSYSSSSSSSYDRNRRRRARGRRDEDSHKNERRRTQRSRSRSRDLSAQDEQKTKAAKHDKFLQSVDQAIPDAGISRNARIHDEDRQDEQQVKRPRLHSDTPSAPGTIAHTAGTEAVSTEGTSASAPATEAAAPRRSRWGSKVFEMITPPAPHASVASTSALSEARPAQAQADELEEGEERPKAAVVAPEREEDTTTSRNRSSGNKSEAVEEHRASVNSSDSRKRVRARREGTRNSRGRVTKRSRRSASSTSSNSSSGSSSSPTSSSGSDSDDSSSSSSSSSSYDNRRKSRDRLTTTDRSRKT
jgi:serine/arginine repetitive matrix protein 2